MTATDPTTQTPTDQPSELDAIRARVDEIKKIRTDAFKFECFMGYEKSLFDISRRLLELLDESTAKINLFQIGICNMQGLTDAELGASIRTTASMEGSETVKTLLGIFDAKDSEIESLRRELAEAKLDAANLRTERVGILGELSMTVAHEERERQKEIGMQEYRGNTVSYIYDKCANYGKQFQEKERKLAEAREKAIEECAVWFESPQNGYTLNGHTVAKCIRSLKQPNQKDL